ncbi:MAG: histidinol-phosphatase [Planctomycetota bacterium]
MPTDPDALARRLELAVAAAREAGEITLRYFGREGLQVDTKADTTPVTVADRQAEEHVRRRILAAFPDDGILGEEFGSQEGQSGYRWIVDPIDGTKSFVHRVPLYGTLVAVERDGDSRLGVIYIPPTRETVYAAAGQGAWYVCGDEPPRPARVSAVDRLRESLVLTTDVVSFEAPGLRDVYDRLERSARLTRTWGDCFGYLMVATGRAEVMLDPVAALWDLAALKPVIEEAGGCFLDFEGVPTIHSRQAIATTPALRDEVLRLVRNR